MKARVSQLCKTEAEWARLPDFVPLQGEVIVFSQDKQYKYPRLKIGDGSTPLRNLPFFVDSSINDFLTKYYGTVIDAGRVTDYKK
jgi:hypothetical protein